MKHKKVTIPLPLLYALIDNTTRCMNKEATARNRPLVEQYKHEIELAMSYINKTKVKPISMVDHKSPDAEEVANYLASKIKTVKELTLKVDSWVKDIEKAIRIDGVSKEELVNTIDWMYTGNGSFWIPNIMSGKKLREKYPTLALQRETENKGNSYGNGYTAPTEEEWNSTDF